MATDVVEERGRLGTTLARQYDADGREIKFDVREDEEQNIKLQETIELLVAAGYFRARIKGLSAFDKVVGGMVWCISLCDFDVDVDLLYQENSTIGQKIALTEKIVKVLPKMSCPVSIEPHQIQGLDFIHIFPVVQWLVKQGIKAREEFGDTIQAIAETQYDVHYTWPEDERLLSEAAKVKSIQRQIQVAPKRLYRRMDPVSLVEEASRVQSTLLEYGSANLLSKPRETSVERGRSAESGDSKEANIENLMAGMTQISEKTPRLSVSAIASAIDESGIRQMAAEFAGQFKSVRRDYKPDMEETPETLINELEKRKSELEATLDENQQKANILKQATEKQRQALEKLRAQDDAITEDLRALEQQLTATDKNSIEITKSLLSQRDEVKQREAEFKARSKEEVTRLQEELNRLQNRAPAMDESEETLNTLHSRLEKSETLLNEVRLDAASINRQIAMLQRRIDDVPSNAELNQYQRRFLELYNQIASKHKETKQFYTLFNTLQDVKTYIEKEVALLNSVYDNYQIALQSDANKLQFLKQLEQSLDTIRQAKLRFEKKEVEEKSKRDASREVYQELLDKQRLYYKTVKDFQEECRKNEVATSLLRDAGVDE